MRPANARTTNRVALRATVIDIGHPDGRHVALGPLD
jgi:hypothetical protein